MTTLTPWKVTKADSSLRVGGYTHEIITMRGSDGGPEGICLTTLPHASLLQAAPALLEALRDIQVTSANGELPPSVRLRNIENLAYIAIAAAEKG
jgi:hypothetical protein